MSRFLISLLMLGVIAAFLAWRMEDHSPGPLAPVHASVARLQGNGGCELCHGPTGSDSWNACFQCHEAIQRQVVESTGFHGQLPNAARCEVCHTEHRAGELPLVRERSFVESGYETMEAFDHAGLDFTLTGKHDDLACEACHPNARQTHLDAGQLRFLGLETGCAGCHEDVHSGTQPRCEDCHSQTMPFARADRFTHDPAFPLVGSHRGLQCLACHPEGSDHSVRASTARADRTPPRACEACHPQRHAQPFLEAFARRERLRTEDACERCHPITAESFAVAPQDFPRTVHDDTGFALSGPHRDVTCDACHAGLGTTRTEASSPEAFAQRFPGRLSSDCQSCHQDPHVGQFANTAGATDCATCHPANTFREATMTPARHAEIGFPLQGAHANTSCAGCHPTETMPDGAHAKRFRGVPRDCAGCHDNPHGRQIDDASGTPRTCTSCHTEDAFHPSTLERDDHASFSGFELRGAHEKLACEACHEPRHLDVRQGIFYSVQLKNVGRSCVDCHTSPHGNQFSSEDGNGCARCHDQEAFLPAHFGLEEHARSSFPLDGAHTATACSSCHPVLPRPTHFVPFRGTPQACASCHPDTHGGRFDHAGRVGDCARCHTTNDFSVGERFEHGKETGFALTGAHEKPRCEACHPRQAEDVTGRTFGRATTTCASCHPDPHAGQFATLSVTDCERCHTTERTWSPTRFDHAQSQFPLDERHRDLECSVCHKPWKLSSGASVTRYRPLGTTCSDCHGGRRKG